MGLGNICIVAEQKGLLCGQCDGCWGGALREGQVEVPVNVVQGTVTTQRAQLVGSRGCGEGAGPHRHGRRDVRRPFRESCASKE